MPTCCRARIDDCLPARPESVPVLRRAVVDFAASCGASQRQREDIALAVSEALSNVVFHAYVGCPEVGVVAVQAWKDVRSLHVVVRDEGVGLRPRVDSPGLGLGLALIGGVTQQLTFEDAAPGLRLLMTFAIDAA